MQTDKFLRRRAPSAGMTETAQRNNGPNTGQERRQHEKKNENKNQLQLSLDLQRQRDYVKELQDKKFDYGLVLANAFVKGMRDLGYKSRPSLSMNSSTTPSSRRPEHPRRLRIRGQRVREEARDVRGDRRWPWDGPTMIRAAVIWGGTHRHNDRPVSGAMATVCLLPASVSALHSAVEGRRRRLAFGACRSGRDRGTFPKGPRASTCERAALTQLPKWVATYIAKAPLVAEIWHGRSDREN